MADEGLTMEHLVRNATAREGKYLTFSLAKEGYGVAITKVKEIIGMIRITPIPQTPEFIKGVINLRGRVIPVMDLRLRLGMEVSEYTERTCIIVVEAVSGGRMGRCRDVKGCGKGDCPAYNSDDLRCWIISSTLCRNEIQGNHHEKIDACRKCNFYVQAHGKKAVFTVGLVVDSVSEVLNIKGSDIEETPTFGARLNTECIVGIAKTGDGIEILLDIDCVLTADQLVMLEKVA